jgi:hypothetical protein
VAAAKDARTEHVPLGVLSLLVGGLLVGGSFLGNPGLLIAVAIVQAGLVAGWVLGTDLPGRGGALVIGIVGSIAVDIAIMRWPERGYAPVLGILGVAVSAMFIHQLVRGVVRNRVVESLADITFLLIAVTAITGFLLLRHQGDGHVTASATMASIAAALAASHFTDAAIPLLRFDPVVDRGLPAVLVGTAVGALIGMLWLGQLTDFANGRGAPVGAGVAVVACLVSIGASFAGHHTASRSRANSTRTKNLLPVAAVLMTVAFSAPAAYVLINAVSG